MQTQNVATTGPVIRDVTELFADSDEQEGYEGNDSDSGPIPKIDSPLGAENILGFTSNLDAESLLSSVAPSSISPTIEMATSSTQQSNIPQQETKGNYNLKKKIFRKNDNSTLSIIQLVLLSFSKRENAQKISTCGDSSNSDSI